MISKARREVVWLSVQRVLDKLLGMCEADVALLLPALEALSMLCLDDELQAWQMHLSDLPFRFLFLRCMHSCTCDGPWARHAVQDAVVGMAIDRLDSVAVADLPAVLHFVLVHADCERRQACRTHSACALVVAEAAWAHNGVLQVVPLVREKLLFLAPADPRLPGNVSATAPINFISPSFIKSLGAYGADAHADEDADCADAPADNELQTFLALRNSLRLAPAACEAFLSELKLLTGAHHLHIMGIHERALAVSDANRLMHESQFTEALGFAELLSFAGARTCSRSSIRPAVLLQATMRAGWWMCGCRMCCTLLAEATARQQARCSGSA